MTWQANYQAPRHINILARAVLILPIAVIATGVGLLWLWATHQ